MGGQGTGIAGLQRPREPRACPTRFPPSSGFPSVSSTLIAQIGLAVLAISGLLVLVLAMRYRRHRAQLARIGAKHALGLATGPCPPSLLEKAGRYEGRDRKASLTEVLVGRGDSTGVFLARRRMGRRRDMLLCFDLGSSAHLEGFFVRPENPGRDGKHDLCLQWRAPHGQWNDERALSMAARAMYNLSVVGDRKGAAPLGLEIRGPRVWVHSRSALRGAELEHFVNDSMRLRALLLKSLARTNDVSRRTGRILPASSRMRALIPG
jgi:hypothetical protein